MSINICAVAIRVSKLRDDVMYIGTDKRPRYTQNTAKQNKIEKLAIRKYSNYAKIATCHTRGIGEISQLVVYTYIRWKPQKTQRGRQCAMG